MRRTLTLPIDEKRFRREDLETLARLLAAERDARHAANDSSELQFDFRFADRSSYQTEDLDIFEEQSALDLKKMHSLDLAYQRYDGSRVVRKAGISVSAEYPDQSYCLVLSDDATWLASMGEKFRAALDAVPPQAIGYRKLFEKLFLVLAFYLWVICIFVLEYIEPLATRGRVSGFISFRDLLDSWIDFYSSDPLLGLAVSVFIYGACMVASMHILSFLEELWPRIEFEFGPEGARLSELRRRRLKFFLIVIAIPALFQIFLELSM